MKSFWNCADWHGCLQSGEIRRADALDTLAQKLCQSFLARTRACKPNFIYASAHRTPCVIFLRLLRVCWYGISNLPPPYSTHANGSRLPFPRTILKSSKNLRSTPNREELYREAPPFLPEDLNHSCRGVLRFSRSRRFL